MDDVLVEPGPAEGPLPETEPETVSLTLASLAQTAEVLLKQGGEGIWGGGFWRLLAFFSALENFRFGKLIGTLATIYEIHF